MNRKKDDKFYTYQSLADFGEACRQFGVVNHTTPKGVKWAGGTVAEALAFARHGDLSQVAKAERLLEKLDHNIDSDGVRPVWHPSVVGNFPIVPAYLAGTPESMMARTDVPDPRGDIEIWASTTVSSICTSADMMRRGVVTMAFAMALSRVRNVRIVLYSTCDRSNVAIRLACPMDVSEVCAAFCQPSITRQLIYGHALRDGFTGRWASWAEVVASRDDERDALCKYAGMPEDAVHLSTETLGSYAQFTDDDLVRTLNEKIKEVVS